MMALLQFLPGVVVGSSTIGNVKPSAEFHFFGPMLCGIAACAVVYKLTEIVSVFCFKGYEKLSTPQKIEWNNRGFSTFHALFAAAASIYLLLLSGLFDQDTSAELIVNRNSTLSNTVLGISIGYFLADLAMILWNFPALGGAEYLLHHGLSLFAIFQALISGQAQIYILMVLFTESTTPFVNLRWYDFRLLYIQGFLVLDQTHTGACKRRYLDTAGQKNSKLYTYNGVALFLGWLVARIVLFIFFFGHMFIHFDQVKQVFPLGFYSLLTIPPTLAMMNLFWFWKILKGMIKTLSKARHRA